MNTQRLFTRRQKQELYVMANGKCVICGIDLEKGWHADHIIPYSKDGETVLENGQALCKSCNLKKNNTYMQHQKLRSWQEEYVKIPYKFYNESKKSFFLNAGVGSGKTYATAVASIPFINEGFKIFIVSPLRSTKKNWSKEFNKVGFGIHYKYDFTWDFRKGNTGASVTYYSLNEQNVRTIINSGIINNKTLLILDEIHHSGLSSAWGGSIQLLGEKAGFVISLTGTPTRSDDQKIPFAKYEPYLEEGKYILKPDMNYSYGQSVKDKICCPISFRSKEVILDGVDGMLCDNEDHRKKLQSVLDVNRNNCIMDMIYEADKELDDLREFKRNAAGLIVCNSIESAKAVQKNLGSDICDVVTSDENDTEDIDRFTNSNKKWLASVRMVSEGVDIPRLRFIVFATDITTPLFFMQVAGRAVRNRNDSEIGTIDHSFFYYFNYEPLVKNAKEIEDQISHIVEDQIDEDIENDEIWCNEMMEERKLRNESEFYNAELGSTSVINAGIELHTYLNKYRNELPINKFIELERDTAELLKSKRNSYHQDDNKNNEYKNINNGLTQIQTNEKLSNLIAKKVNKMAINKNIPFNEMHKYYNDLCGIVSAKIDSRIPNEYFDKLQKKYLLVSKAYTKMFNK